MNFRKLNEDELAYGFEAGLAVNFRQGEFLLPLIEEYLGENVKDLDFWLSRSTYDEETETNRCEDHYFFRSKALMTQVYLRFHANEL